MSEAIKGLEELVAALEVGEGQTELSNGCTLESLDLKARILPLLNDRAKVLINNEIHSIAYTKIVKYELGEHKYVTECIYACKLVPMNEQGGIDDIYIEKWAKMLNFLADTGVWAHGVLVGCSAIKLAKMEGNFPNLKFLPPSQFGLYSFLHTSTALQQLIGMEFGGPSIKQMGTIALNKKINEFIGWDVMKDEGEIGTTDWGNCPF